MLTNRTAVSLLGLVAFTALACVTINVYFPEAAIKDLSQQIEEEVRKQAEAQEQQEPVAEPPAEAEAGEPRSGLLDTLLGVTPAYAQDVPEPGISNPAIRKIIQSRGERAAVLDRYKAQGVIGENRQALLEILELDALSDLRARAEVQKLVRAENADREQLFKEVAAAEGVDLSQLPRIRETYAETMRANARPGHWIQTPDGAWNKK